MVFKTCVGQLLAEKSSELHSVEKALKPHTPPREATVMQSPIVKGGRGGGGESRIIIFS